MSMVTNEPCGPLHTCVALAIPFLYVGSIYALDGTRDKEQHRNHPTTVKRRFLAASLSTFVSLWITVALLGESYPNPFKPMGLRLDLSSLLHSMVALGLTATFYLGHWVDMAMGMDAAGGVGGWRDLLDWQAWRNSFSDLLWVRHTIMAPITEELVFRSCCATLVAHCFGWKVAVWMSPLCFAGSHIHHVVEDLRQGHSLVEALFSRGFQSLYTYLFGVYATYLLMRTESIIAPILCHSLCNNLGLPSVPFQQEGGRGWWWKGRGRLLLWVMQLARTAIHLLGFFAWYQFLLRL